jgi:dihydroorotase
MNPVILRNARLLDEASPFHDQPVHLRLDNGTITDVVPVGEDLEAEEAIEHDLTGAYLSPGWIDLIADYREPGYEQKETIRTGLDAAAAGGFTGVGLLPNTMPAVDSRGGVQYAMGLGTGHAVALYPYGALSQKLEGKTLAEMLDMRAGGAIGFTDGWKGVQNPQLLLKALEYVKAFEGLIVQLPHDTALAAGGLMHEGLMSTRLGMAGIPAIAENLAVHRDLELLRYTGSRLHLTGITTAASVELIRQAKNDGLDVTCSVTPYHLLLTDASLHDYDSSWKLTPPLRPEQDRQALIAGLADGTVDVVTSHHRPQEWDSKAKEFEYAGEGLAVQEVLFPLLQKAVGNAVPLHRLVDALCRAPRRILGLSLAPLQVGAVAQMTIFTPDGVTNTARNGAWSKAYNNPFLDVELPGKVLGIAANHKLTL